MDDVNTEKDETNIVLFEYTGPLIWSRWTGQSMIHLLLRAASVRVFFIEL